MKTCSLCNTLKPEQDFTKKSASKDGLSSRCRTCSTSEGRRRYKEDPIRRAKVRQRSLTNKPRYKIDLQNRMLEYLSDKSCVDCGYDSHPAALQFDHVRGVKRESVSVMVSSLFAWSTILEEIQKCEIRCANCHAIKTAEQFGHYTHGSLAEMD